MNITLYTKNNCQPCANVKEYIAQKGIQGIEIVNCNDNPERISEFYNHFQTFPCMKVGEEFIAPSEKILEYLASMPIASSVDNTPKYDWGV